MSFFNEEQAKTGSDYEAGTSFEPIPEGTSVKAMVEDAQVKEWEGDKYINLRWTVLAPESYNNRKVFQKVKVWDADSKKADKAKRMLAAIDSNCGGKIVTANKEPDDALLQQALLNKPMVLKLGVWDLTDEGKGNGNWIMAVSSTQTDTTPAPAQDEPSEEMPF